MKPRRKAEFSPHHRRRRLCDVLFDARADSRRGLFRGLSLDYRAIEEVCRRRRRFQFADSLEQLERLIEPAVIECRPRLSEQLFGPALKYIPEFDDRIVRGIKRMYFAVQARGLLQFIAFQRGRCGGGLVGDERTRPRCCFRRRLSLQRFLNDCVCGGNVRLKRPDTGREVDGLLVATVL